MGDVIRSSGRGGSFTLDGGLSQRSVRRERVCANCVEDDDLQSWIRDQEGAPGCHFCRERDAPTSDIDDLAEFIRERIERNYSLAVEELPYESAEGGYQGITWDTYDLLTEELEIGFPRRGGDDLIYELYERVGPEIWCELDWTRLDEGAALRFSWDEFCETIKHQRRFFFTSSRLNSSRDETLGPIDLLNAVRSLLDEADVVRTLPKGFRIYRARPDNGNGAYTTPGELGPPPPHLATQSNRMNPPGVPMTYCAESSSVAMAEVRADKASVGVFRLLRDVRILDLTQIPSPPGFFGNDNRKLRLTRSFLCDFERQIMKSVERDERVHVDYIPSQVVTEFFREYGAESGPIDGIRYRSTVHKEGCNLVLFATQENVRGVLEDPWGIHDEWIEFISARHVVPGKRYAKSLRRPRRRAWNYG